MSAELHKLNHRIRERKKKLRHEIKNMSELDRRLRKFIARNGLPADRLTIQLASENRGRLGRRRAALQELVDLTRR